MELSSINTASVSDITIHAIPNQLENDTESILSLINMLDFNIKENEKDLFFDELETVLNNSEKAKEDFDFDVVNFLIKHVVNDNKIYVK